MSYEIKDISLKETANKKSKTKHIIIHFIMTPLFLFIVGSVIYLCNEYNKSMNNTYFKHLKEETSQKSSKNVS